MTKPLISIITICYNEKYIEKTCVSIVNQTLQDFEWIVVDGASTDGTTLNILNKYRNKMTVFISEKDTGRFNAMNKGIKKARGKWLIFMNGGDTFHDFNVLKDVFYHKKYCGIDVLYGLVERIKGSWRYIAYKPSILDLDFMKNDSIGHAACFIKRSLFKKYGGYNESFQIVSDWLKWIEFLKARCSFYYLGIVVASYNLEGISSQGLTGRHKQEKEKVIKEYILNSENDDYLDNMIVRITSKKSFGLFLKKKINQLLKKLFG